MRSNSNICAPVSVGLLWRSPWLGWSRYRTLISDVSNLSWLISFNLIVQLGCQGQKRFSYHSYLVKYRCAIPVIANLSVNEFKMSDLSTSITGLQSDNNHGPPAAFRVTTECHFCILKFHPLYPHRLFPIPLARPPSLLPFGKNADMGEDDSWWFWTTPISSEG